MRKIVMAAALSALLAGLPAAARAADADVLREAKDRADIEDLMWRYSRATDTFDADAYVSVYTPDGAFMNTKGRDALHKMIADFRTAPNGPPKMYHAESNRMIEFVDRDHARIHYYWQTYMVPPATPRPAATPAASGASAPAVATQRPAASAAETPPRLLAVGNGVDDVVRMGGKWLIKTRNISASE